MDIFIKLLTINIYRIKYDITKNYKFKIDLK